MMTVYAIVYCLHSTCAVWGANSAAPSAYRHATLEACEARLARMVKPPPYDWHCAAMDVPAWRIIR